MVDTGRNFTLRGVVRHRSMDGWLAGTIAAISIDDGRVRSLVPDGLPDLTAAPGRQAWRGGRGAPGCNRHDERPEQSENGAALKETLRAYGPIPSLWAVGDDGLVVLCGSTCHTVKSGVRRTLNAIGYHGQGFPGRRWPTASWNCPRTRGLEGLKAPRDESPPTCLSSKVIHSRRT